MFLSFVQLDYKQRLVNCLTTRGLRPFLPNFQTNSNFNGEYKNNNLPASGTNAGINLTSFYKWCSNNAGICSWCVQMAKFSQIPSFNPMPGSRAAKTICRPYGYAKGKNSSMFGFFPLSSVQLNKLGSQSTAYQPWRNIPHQTWQEFLRLTL